MAVVAGELGDLMHVLCVTSPPRTIHAMEDPSIVSKIAMACLFTNYIWRQSRISVSILFISVRMILVRMILVKIVRIFIEMVLVKIEKKCMTFESCHFRGFF